MNGFLNNNISENLKITLREIIPAHCSIIEFANVKLYISYDGDKNFSETNLEGCLCLLINRHDSCLYLQLFDLRTYHKEFELELYTNIDKGYTVLNDLFHCIEYPTFFIGINFSNKINAEKLKNTIFYNSIILNAQPNLYHLASSRKEKEAAEENKNNNSNLLKDQLIIEMNDFAKKISKPKNIVNCAINRDENKVIFSVEREEFDSNLSSLGIFISNLDMHYEKKIKGLIKNKETRDMSNQNKVEEEEKKFVAYNMNKKKSIQANTNTIAQRNSTYNNNFINESKNSEKRKTIKEIINFQSGKLSISNSNNEVKSFQDEIRDGIKLKSAPKNVLEKKQIKLTPLSNDPALQMAIKMQNNQIVETDSDIAEEDDD